MAKISKEDVLRLAKLSKLDLTDEQIAKFQTELQAIVGYVEQLQEVDVEGLEPTKQVTGLKNVMREDELREYVSREELLKNLPDRQEDYIKVKRVIE